MPIVLQPLSHPKLETLTITGGLCLIGRGKPPFAEHGVAASLGWIRDTPASFRKEARFI